MFRENDGVTLASDLQVKAFQPAVTLPGDSSATTTLPAGTNVCTYFIHVDPDFFDQNFDATIDFHTSVLGFSLDTTDLNATAEFAYPGLDYHYEGLTQPDTLLTSGDTTQFHSDYTTFGRDQVRVFVAC